MIRLLLLITFQVGVLVATAGPALRALRDPGALARRVGAATSVEGLTAEVLGLLAPWLAGWLLAITVVDARRAMGAARTRSAPRWIRTVVDQALGTLLLLGTMAGPASAAMPAADAAVAPVEQPVTPEHGVLTAPTDAPRSPSLSPAAATADVIAATAVATSPHTPEEGRPPAEGDVAAAGSTEDGEPDAEDAAADERLHVVARGENLWVIARGHLGALGQATHDRSVHAYWTRLIQDNVDRLASGDPDLIHPGEQLRLPDMPTTP